MERLQAENVTFTVVTNRSREHWSAPARHILGIKSKFELAAEVFSDLMKKHKDDYSEFIKVANEEKVLDCSHTGPPAHG